MKRNTRLVFKSLLRRFNADCVCDIGSCDGTDSLLFREILPEAELFAFEANPIMYRKIQANPAVTAARVKVFHCAISGSEGTARFHVMDLDYDGPAAANRGTSSLLVDEGGREKETVEVQTHRIDEFIATNCPRAQRIGLWIDVEGAEFWVLQGMEGIKDRVVAAHVETSRVATRTGQKVYAEVEALMKSLGFDAVCIDLSNENMWGDVVFLNREFRAKLGFRYHFCQAIANLAGWLRVDLLGLFLKKHCNFIYRPLWRLYMRLFT